MTDAPFIAWPSWQRILFRFFFIYWILYIAPWTWFEVIPGISWLMQFYYSALDGVVNLFNHYIFRIKEQLVPINGSGDTSFGWAQMLTYLLIAAVITCIWTIINKNKKEYTRLNYWLCLVVRYNIALVCFTYGFIKVFSLQMPFPTYSQLATPLGDLLPMRLSWMFMGYSHLYQGFSGVMEVIAGFLLLYRRTTVLGCMLAAGVFLNVAMLNLSYDIPVKLFAIHVLLMCIFLLVIDYRRMIDFFVLNRNAAPSVLYAYTPTKKWMKFARIGLKLVMISIGVGFSFYQNLSLYNEIAARKIPPPLQAGMYDVTAFALNGDTIPPLITDPVRWLDIAIDDNGWGSIATNDTTFPKRYNRGYFLAEPDTLKHLITFRISRDSSQPAPVFHYETPDQNTIKLFGKKGNDSLYVMLKKSNRRFQLADKPFHWLSEQNR